MSIDQRSSSQRKQESVFWTRGVGTWNPEMLKESTHVLKVSTHADNEQSGIEVSTDEYSIQQSEIKVSTHRVEESTHKDSRQTGIKMSTHALWGVDPWRQ